MEVIIKLSYDYDNELRYTEKEIEIDELELWKAKNKVIVNLYEEDIKKLVEGTGIDINAE